MPEAVLFIDEIHTVIGAGALGWGDGCVQFAEAGAAKRRSALHGLNHL